MWTSVNSKNSPKAETSSGPRGLIFVHWHHIGSIWMHPNREKISRAFVSIWAFVNLMILMFLQALESIIYMLPLEKSFVSLTTLLFLRALCEPIIYMLQLKWAFCRPVIHLFPFLLMILSKISRWLLLNWLRQKLEKIISTFIFLCYTFFFTLWFFYLVANLPL